MVADKVEVFTRSSETKESPGYRWSSEGCVVPILIHYIRVNCSLSDRAQ